MVEETPQPDAALDVLLSKGLRDIPTATPSPDFNKNVLRRLKRPWWTAVKSSRHWQRLPAWSLGATSLLFLSLLLSPVTGWIVRSQIGLDARLRQTTQATLEYGVRGMSASPANIAQNPLLDAAGRLPSGDFNLQLAAVLLQSAGADPLASNIPSSSLGDAIRSLKSRFAHEPSLYANALRMDVQARVQLGRLKEQRLVQPRARNYSSFTGYTPSREHIEQFISDCKSGERVQPDNGYFPMLRAAALFQAGRDAEALSAIRRASGCSFWDPHFRDEVDGKWRLIQHAGGSGSALNRMVVYGSVIFPEMDPLIRTAQVAAGIAVRKELAGRWRDGLRIRLDLARCGALMRAQAPSLFANRIGIRITQIASTAPGGKSTPLKNGLSTAEAQAVIADRMAHYLMSRGANEEAAWFAGEWKLTRLFHDNLGNLSHSPYSEGQVASLFESWLGGMLLVSNSLWLLVLGALSGLYLLRQRKRRAAGWAREDPFVFVIGALSLGLAVALVAWSQGQSAYALAAYDNLTYPPLISASNDFRTSIEAMFAGVLLVVPAVLGVAAYLAAVVRRRPASLMIARALRTVGLPLAALLMLGYAILVIGTAEVESDMHRSLSEMLHHEGRYMALIHGVEWPRRGDWVPAKRER